MNPSSFEYNTAIQQITAQEQGEARQMLNVFRDAYLLENRPWLYDKFLVAILIILCIIALILLGSDLDALLN